jgi:hypothetical protein
MDLSGGLNLMPRANYVNAGAEKMPPASIARENETLSFSYYDGGG